MKNLFAVMASFLGTLVFALPPKASFDSMSNSGDDIKLNFTIQEAGGFPRQKITLVDDDGVGTLATLQYMLIQTPSQNLRKSHDFTLLQSVWDKMKGEPVEGWDKNVRSVYLRALERAKNFYKELKAEQVVRELDTILNKLKFSKQIAPTYEDLNEIGEWLNRHAKGHAYTMEVREPGKQVQVRNSQKLIDNNTGNSLGTALAGIGFTLPSKGHSRSAATFDVDLKTILQRYLAPAGTDGSKEEKTSTHR